MSFLFVAQTKVFESLVRLKHFHILSLSPRQNHRSRAQDARPATVRHEIRLPQLQTPIPVEVSAGGRNCVTLH